MPIENEKFDAARAMALLLETASEQFTTLRGLVDGKFLFLMTVNTTSPAAQSDCFRALRCVRMALAKEFLFNSARIYRLLEHGNFDLIFSGEQRKRFMVMLKPVVNTRDVNEHGFDAVGSSRGRKISRPSLHKHDDVNVAADETSLVVIGPDRILLGPLNLAEIFAAVESMRLIAGYSSLDRKAG